MSLGFPGNLMAVTRIQGVTVRSQDIVKCMTTVETQQQAGFNGFCYGRTELG